MVYLQAAEADSAEALQEYTTEAGDKQGGFPLTPFGAGRYLHWTGFGTDVRNLKGL